MNPIGVFDYTTAYGKPLPQDTFALLRPYPTDLIVLYLFKVNVILFQESDPREQAIKIFKHVFLKPDRPQPDYEKNVNRTLSHDHQVIFAVQSISYLIKESLSHYRTLEDINVSPENFNKALFDTILIYNKVVFHTEPSALETHEGLWEIAIRQQNYIRDFNALLYTAPIKFLLVQRYFDSAPDAKKIMDSFQQNLGLGNVWNFAKTFMDLMGSVLSEDRTGQYIFHRNEIPPQALELFSYEKNVKKDKMSIHMDMVPKPFYQVDTDHFAVIDFSYFRYILDQGLFWCIFYNSCLNKGDVGKSFNIFRSRIGKAYFEEFLVGNLMKSIFDRAHHVIIETPPREDFWIRPNQKDLIIIEVKMADINPLTSEAFDVDRFRQFIIDNYAKPKDDNGGAKGVFQLINQLRLLENSTREDLEKFKIGAFNKLNVYPIIIYSDQIMDAVGVNDMVQSLFEAQLEKEAVFSFNIKPVTMICINTLLEQFAYLKSEPGNLISLVHSYHRYLRAKKKDYVRFGGPFLYYNQNVSFSEYVLKVNGRGKEGFLNNTAVFKKQINSGRFGSIDKPLQ
ncbi:hypothetical protein [Mucilaginibacter phyllosphaerae]